MSLGRTIAAINGSMRRTGTTPTSAYQTVFGIPYFEPFGGVTGYSLSEIRSGNTPIERSINSGSVEMFEHYAACGELTTNDVPLLGDLATDQVIALIEQNSGMEMPEDEILKNFSTQEWSTVPEELRPGSTHQERGLICQPTTPSIYNSV